MSTEKPLGEGEPFKNSENNSEPENNNVVQIEKKHTDLVRRFKNKEEALAINEKLIAIEKISQDAFKKVADYIDTVYDTAQTVYGEYSEKNSSGKSNPPKKKA